VPVDQAKLSRAIDQNNTQKGGLATSNVGSCWLSDVTPMRFPARIGATAMR
jgi:hypothetical protein